MEIPYCNLLLLVLSPANNVYYISQDLVVYECTYKLNQLIKHTMSFIYNFVRIGSISICLGDINLKNT